MNTRFLCTAAGSLMLALLSPAALADHIDGHNNSDPVFPIPLPGQEFFDGGAAFVSAIGPLGGTEITGATFDITYVSDGVEDASNLLISVSYLTPDFNLIDFHLTGAELGFGSGAGTFQGSFSTNALNGVVAQSFLLPPNSQINVDIASVDGFIDGEAYFVDSFIYLDVVPAPASIAPFAALGLVATRRRR